MSESKGHIEFRKNGESKFYAPDRDVLYLYPTIMKAALATTAESCSDEAYENFKVFVKAVADVHNKSITTEDDVSKIIADAINECQDNKECFDIFVKTVLTGIFAVYIHALRDSVNKPVLTEQQLEGSLKATNILSMLPDDLRAKVKPYILMASGGVSTFGTNDGTFTKE